MQLAVAAVAEAAPAKINLALHVVGRRADGYHLIESLSVFTAFGDRIAVEPAARDVVSVRGPFAAEVPDGPENLVVRARDALRAVAGRRAGDPVLIALEKNIPAMSGVGGGSSDAAAVLRALARHWDLDIGAARLAEIGLSLGADVPMCLRSSPLMARGVGEDIEDIDGFPPLFLVLVNPRVAVATPRVFAALASRDNPPLPPLPERIAAAPLLDWLAATRNDLMTPALSLEPAIGGTLDVLAGEGALFSRMSGSGATCFGVFADGAAARDAAAAIAAARPDWFVTATGTGGSGSFGQED
jgi:4-diphosphocytidyl-2-C-methyl-D-erythritol kinase